MSKENKYNKMYLIKYLTVIFVRSSYQLVNIILFINIISYIMFISISNTIKL